MRHFQPLLVAMLGMNGLCVDSGVNALGGNASFVLLCHKFVC